MGCKGCPGSSEAKKEYDKHGYKIEHPGEATEREMHEQSHPRHSPQDEARQLTYREYLNRRKMFREEAVRRRDAAISQFSDDYKRIQIDELISVYNLEEVHFKLTPEQAISALWDLVHDEGYQKVVKEFDGLVEAIDKRYAELQKNKIELKWQP